MDTRQQCKGCTYFRGVDYGKHSYHFCHHLLYTNKRRQVGENDLCLSRSTEAFVRRRIDPYDSFYDGFY